MHTKRCDSAKGLKKNCRCSCNGEHHGKSCNNPDVENVPKVRSESLTDENTIPLEDFL